MKSNNTYIAPNECTIGRWFAVWAVSMTTGLISTVLLQPFLRNQTSTFMGISFADLFGVLTFVPLFWTMVPAIRFLGKTSLKDFILGAGGKVNQKHILTVLILYVVGFLLSFLPILNSIRLRNVNRGEYAFLVLFTLLLIWMQTTWEELIYRGLFIRWACKNKVNCTKKSLRAAVLSALAFALSHMVNPEITSQSGLQIVLTVVTYMLPGFVYFLADLHFGNLLPGIIMHWVHNFLFLTVISSDSASAVTTSTLLINGAPASAVWTFASTMVIHLPMLVYLLTDILKKKKPAAIKQEVTAEK